MFSDYLIPEQTVTENGSGPVLPVDENDAEIQLTLGITEAIEHESLNVEVWGSDDGNQWGEDPLLSFPQKCSKGKWTMLLDFDIAPDVQFLQARWKVNRWGGLPAEFHFYLFAQGLKSAA